LALFVPANAAGTQEVSTPKDPGMRILALDLGSASTQTHAHLLDTESGEKPIRRAFPTMASAFLDVVKELLPDRVVVEATPISGHFVDLCEVLGLPIQVANVRDPAWQNRTSKTDRNDAELLARLSASGQLRTVEVPPRDIRQWRLAIHHRHELVRCRTRIKNRIRALLRNELQPPVKNLWSVKGLRFAASQAKDPGACTPDERWRGVLSMELARYKEIQAHITTASKQLDALVDARPAAALLTTIPGVGYRLAEAVVACLVTAKRFKNRKQVVGYVGLCPRVQQSGQHTMYGRITKTGNSQLRSLLVEVAQLGSRRDPWMKAIFAQIQGKSPKNKRTNRAVTAVARRLLVRCWAVLRDHENGLPPRPTAASPVAA